MKKLWVSFAVVFFSVNHGYWFARSSEFLSSPVMQTRRWMRVPGDTIFALGAFILVAFVFRTYSAKQQAQVSGELLPAPAAD